MKINKEFKTIHNNIQKEALINEIKGNLFEYLVAHHCAKRLKIENAFLESFSGDMKSMLMTYEKWLRQNDRELISKLQTLSMKTSNEVSSYIESILNEGEIIKTIVVIGKITGGHHNDIFKEADIIFSTSEREIPLSLKLSKKNAFVNTKSAGAKSFVSKYFDGFVEAPIFQSTYNDIIDKLFFELGEKLYERHGLEFSGRFDSTWDGPDLPGELDEEDRADLHYMYQELSRNLYQTLKQFFEISPDRFMASLFPLLGQGSDNLIQVTCFHQEKVISGVKNRYEFSSVSIKDYATTHTEVEFLPFKDSTSSFDIRLNDDILQIRIKPMNKFTTASYKVNCSVRSINE
ncbi:hypothetical protein [Bacteriovorax sp. Seq25_V]|uniref:hypothetical protein n=1 Tax=Bacteriovorax sp. Seq25_V TaxID=1201288 RepID=UPI00038A3DB6|nr:hypothetical protein [Bacteriovorax sp. Seq25_V]EQC46312.1 hypothetical protein M900_1076 [Bacteriovorax sp. Seq25_V]